MELVEDGFVELFGGLVFELLDVDKFVCPLVELLEVELLLLVLLLVVVLLEVELVVLVLFVVVLLVVALEGVADGTMKSK